MKGAGKSKIIGNEIPRKDRDGISGVSRASLNDRGGRALVMDETATGKEPRLPLITGHGGRPTAPRNESPARSGERDAGSGNVELEKPGVQMIGSAD